MPWISFSSIFTIYTIRNCCINNKLYVYAILLHGAGTASTYVMCAENLTLTFNLEVITVIQCLRYSHHTCTDSWLRVTAFYIQSYYLYVLDVLIIFLFLPLWIYRFLIGQYVTIHGDVISHVNISHVMVEDGGEYSCTASNRAGKVSHSARLNVYGKLTVI